MAISMSHTKMIIVKTTINRRQIMIRTPKIYLDTSAISHLDRPGKPSEYEYTHLFWGGIGKCDVYISEVVVRELAKCDDENA
jgi:hypothetical protein